MEMLMTGKDILEPATLAGLGVVAVWLYVCHPRLRPRTLTRAMIHVAVSFLLFAALPYTVDFWIGALPKPFSVIAFVALVMLPVLGYVVFSWLALMAKLHDLADSKPSGGHPVPDAG